MKQEFRENLTGELVAAYGAGSVMTRSQILEINDRMGYPFPHFIINKENRVGHCKYVISAQKMEISSVSAKEIKPEQNDSVAEVVLPMKVQGDLSMDHNGFSQNLIPSIDPLFVPFGNYSTIKSILESQQFYPIFVTGMSGNGKTYMVEQCCAKTRRKVIRVNFTIETDEDDLIGGFRLVNGETKFFKGPVIKAMEQGAVLLCDEIDLANPAKIMCLQSILEGSGYFIKKTGEYIEPRPGFTVVSTANTKGKGSSDGRFIATNVLNEAFLERFPITCEQEYPTPAVEKKMLGKLFESLNLKDEEFITLLVDWADIIRKTFADGGIDEIISTRRLVHIAKAHSIFNDRMKAIDLCINRFDDDTKYSFRELYAKIDVDVNPEDIPF